MQEGGICANVEAKIPIHDTSGLGLCISCIGFLEGENGMGGNDEWPMQLGIGWLQVRV